MVRRHGATGTIAVLLGLASSSHWMPRSTAQGGADLLDAASGEAVPSGCVTCHAGIEDMHPEADLSCVDCHGGDPTATRKLEAHVAESNTQPGDERVAPLERDLARRRFENPMDLRVVEQTCGTCHEHDVDNLHASLHGTTAGHLSDGFYEMGLFESRGSRYSVFPQRGAPRRGGEVDRLGQVPPFRDRLPEHELSTHYTDLPRKECMQCHLWSEGRAVRGRVGFDGDYRGEGCAACHVTYARDGLSRSADPTVARGEPGHPQRHEMTRAPTTETCTTCHYGDASIGLHYRGFSQLPPNTPGGPDIPGTTDEQLNRVFYLDDPSICPPDVHHERGMHCIDCHTKGDVMGDGMLHGQMENAVEISCQACHGSFDGVSTLATERGTPLEHLSWDGEHVVLTGKVDGAQRVVPQAVHVLDPDRPEFNSEAARAMTGAHADVECYTCHAGWNANFLGFHFSRQTALTQLDLLSGKRTPGRVTTQEKVFATWKSFYAGLNERGAVAPYLTGFSTMGSVWDEDGELVLDQVMPVTAEGLSGMTMIHHQLHSTRPTARSCVECHRTSSTWGMGSPNFRIGRQLAFVADRRGLEIIGIDRAEPARSAPLAKLVLPDVVALAVHADPLQGHAHHVYAAEGGRGVHVIDVSNPLAPRRVAFVATLQPRGLELVGDLLYLADGVGGLVVFDVEEPAEIHRVGGLATFDAHDVSVSWPWAFVADGAGGLLVADVHAPIAPSFLSAFDVNGALEDENEAIAVETLFQYSRPVAEDGKPADERVPARHVCAVLDRSLGLHLLDVTQPTAPRLLHPEPGSVVTTSSRNPGISYRGMALRSQVDPAETQGGERTTERDYVYLIAESGQPENRRSANVLIDVSVPTRLPRARDRGVVPAGFSTEGLAVADLYNPPFRQRLLLTAGERGVYVADVTTSREPVQLGALPALLDAYVVAIEEFPLDRMIDESGRRLKDVSHEPSRWLYRTEVERILDVPAAELGLDPFPAEEPFGLTARLHLEAADSDGSGRLEGKEYEGAGGAAIDDDGDGRITLLELGRRTPAVEAARREDASLSDAGTLSGISARTYKDGDLARLLDGVNPFDFDEDASDGLDRKEAERAVFHALDLDGSGKLSRDELSRHPGPARELRFHDSLADRILRAVDKNEDGRITPREFRLADDEWDVLDADGDGEILLVAGAYEYQRERGHVGPGSEWPARREQLVPLPPGITTEAILVRFDGDGDGELERDELEARPELFATLDRNRDGRVVQEEIDRLLRAVDREGVDALPDDFLGRWDLDRSGSVEPEELSGTFRRRLSPFLERR